MENEIGTDISAIFWKKCQNVQLQKQLDQSHNITNHSNVTNKKRYRRNNERKDYTNDKIDMKILKKLNIDLYFKMKRKRKKSCRSFTKTNKKFSQIKVYMIFKYLLKIYKQCVRDIKVKKRTKKDCNTREMKGNDTQSIIKQNIFEYLIRKNKMTYSRNDKIFQNDIFNIFSYIAHFIDCRKSKLYVRYMLSDGVERIGIILGHPIFPAIPLWIFDVIRLISNNNQLYLIYSTDTRNVAKWFGHLTSLVNLSNLLHMKIEQGNSDINATLILLHLGGIFTKNLTDPINRQGMKYPCSVLQKTTFENVKNQLLKISKEKKLYDNLSSFISSTIMCVPRCTGTNSFNLLMGKTHSLSFC